MKKGNLFLLIVLTAFCIYLFNTGRPEAYAVGTIFTILTIIGWTKFLNNE